MSEEAGRGSPLSRPLRIVVLCTVAAGVDTVVELIRRKVVPSAIVGLHPDTADPVAVSGWIDVAEVGAQYGVAYQYVNSYALTAAADRAALETLAPDLVLITGWQRLVPDWLLDCAALGVLGNHGSPDGIHGGRGRSPQTWALMLGCRRFDLALFKVTPGIDDGPILDTRSFSYTEEDDIQTSYYRASLAMADMIVELLEHPVLLDQGLNQPPDGYYFPQRRPEDGWVDWSLPAKQVASHCRALTHPYPGLRTAAGGSGVTIWRCQPFDDDIRHDAGTVGPCFTSGEFLVHCQDGRLLIREWACDDPQWRPEAGMVLKARGWRKQLVGIVERHEAKHPDFQISPRIMRQIKDSWRMLSKERRTR